MSTKTKAAPKKRPVGRPKKIETADEMMKHFTAYEEEVRSHPIKVVDFKGKDADRVEMEYRRPLTLEGFEVYCYNNNIIKNLGDYFANTEGRYKDFTTICSHIRRIIRTDQIEGGMAGVYNPSITQRLNGLVDKREIETKDVEMSDAELEKRIEELKKRLNL
jgi:hypothetical protein